MTMSVAGYDPAALVRYIERVQPPDSRFSPFPPRDERIAALRETIGKLPSANDTFSEEFLVVREQARAEAPERPKSHPALKRLPQ